MKINDICIERPVGTSGNKKVSNYLQRLMYELNFQTIELPFECSVWQRSKSYLNETLIHPSPFSRSLRGSFSVKFVSNLADLFSIDTFAGVLIFIDELSKASFMPRNFPFYFPDTHRIIYETLDRISPCGIVAITGQDPYSGLNPFPIFCDTLLQIPTAFVSSLNKQISGQKVNIEINSNIYIESAKQLVFRKEGKTEETIVVMAHLDTKYDTRGAIDNASGIVTLYEIAKLISRFDTHFSIEIVPLNGEEHPEVPGQLAYLNYLSSKSKSLKLAINIDGVGHIGSPDVFSFYNFDRKQTSQILCDHNLIAGETWFSSDHSIFAMRDIPSIAVTSKKMFSTLTKILHTDRDIPNLVDHKKLLKLANTITNICTNFPSSGER
jgi:aminopeptidase YwaD